MALIQSSNFSKEFASLEITGVQLTGRKLGKGSDAAVQEVNWLGTLCAAKQIHEILLEDDTPGGAKRFIDNFEKECMTWSKLIHPRIVQFLGVYFVQGSRIPWLILEKVDTSLRYYLETHEREKFSLPNKIFILRQVAQALSYLHSRSPPLVHHDLSSNNILLNEVSLQAKVTDFGMTRAMDPSKMTRKSSVKGTLAFMSPEALHSPPKYDEKLDVFSYGNVIVTTVIHDWPEPGPPTGFEEEKIIGFSELQRRKQYLALFTQKEKELFLPIVSSCLQNNPSKRPTSNELVSQLNQIETSNPRVSSESEIVAQLRKDQDQLRQTLTDLEKSLKLKDDEIDEHQTRLCEKDEQMQKLLEEYGHQQKEIAELQQEIDLLRKDQDSYHSKKEHLHKRIHELQEEVDRLREISSPIHKSPLDRAEHWKMQGNEWFKADRCNKAILCYREALSVCPESNTKERAVYYQNIAAAQEKLAQNEQNEANKTQYLLEVVDSSSEALKLNPHYAKPYVRRGRAYSLLSQDYLALLDYTALSILDGSLMKLSAADYEKVLQGSVEMRVDQIIANRAPGTPETISHTHVSELMNLGAMKYLKRAGVKEIWTLWCKRNNVHYPGELKDQPLMKAVTAFERRRYSKVLPLCKEALEIGAEFLKPYARLVNVTLLQLMHRKDKALAGITEILQLQDVPAEVRAYAYIMEAEVYIKDGNMTMAQTAYENAFNEHSPSPDVYMVRAKYYQTLGLIYTPPARMDDMRKACVLTKDYPVIAANYAYALFKMGVITNSKSQVEEALDKFKQAVKKFPNSAFVYATYGQVLYETFQIDMALVNYRKAIELEPKNGVYHVSLCFAVMLSGKSFDEFSHYVENAIARDPFWTRSYLILASLEANRGNMGRAAELFERACQFNMSKMDLTQCVTVTEIKNAKLKVCSNLGLDPKDVTMNGCPDLGHVIRDNVTNIMFADMGINLQDLVSQVVNFLQPFLGNCKQM